MSFPQTTPLRPVPGAFLNTPAALSRFQNQPNDPTQRRLFTNTDPGQNAAVSNANPSSLPGGQNDARATTTLSTAGQPKGDDLPPILVAAKTINSNLQLDESFPELDSYCRRKRNLKYIGREQND